MQLVEIFLPVYDNRGRRFAAKLYKAERESLVERFGGMTAHSQSPAKGLWKDKGRTEKDELIIFEVMVKRLDLRWWRSYRRKLEKTFKQKELLVRAHPVLAL
jgi:hypothetical protein